VGARLRLVTALIVAGVGLWAAPAGAQTCNPVGVVCPTTTTTRPKVTTTTSTTTTTVAPTTTTTTRPRTTTTRRTIPVTTRTTPPTTIAPTTATTPPPPPTALPPLTLELSQPSIEPGGQLTVDGTGCSASSPVRLTLGDSMVGTAVSDGAGAFSTPITVPDIPLGQYQLVAVCGPTLSTLLDLAVASSTDVGTGMLGLFFFFFLLVLMLFRRRRLVRRS
jgi:hypothetical protein